MGGNYQTTIKDPKWRGITKTELASQIMYGAFHKSLISIWTTLTWRNDKSSIISIFMVYGKTITRTRSQERQWTFCFDTKLTRLSDHTYTFLRSSWIITLRKCRYHTSDKHRCFLRTDYDLWQSTMNHHCYESHRERRNTRWGV